jgi:hypothetical protein
MAGMSSPPARFLTLEHLEQNKMAIKKELSKTQWKKQQAVEHNHLRDWNMAIDEHMLRGFEWDRQRKVSTPNVKQQKMIGMLALAGMSVWAAPTNKQLRNF